MIKFLFWLILILPFFQFSFNNGAQNEDQPFILFEKTIHNFGNVDYTDTLIYDFKFKNAGKKPLVIFECKSSCGCTVSECPQFPILPKNTGFIKVKFKPESSGSFFKTITVKSNALNNEVILQIKGTIRKKR